MLPIPFISSNSCGNLPRGLRSTWVVIASSASLGAAIACQAPAGAVTLADNIGETPNSGVAIGYVLGTVNWQAMKFNTTSASVINEVVVSLKKDLVNPPTQGTLFFDIYTANGDVPDVFVSTIGSLVASSISGSTFTDYFFSPLSLALSKNSSYFLVARPDNFAASTVVDWETTSSTSGFVGLTTPVRSRSSNNGGTWFVPGDSNYAMLQIQASIVPGPVPLLGASAAFAWSRRLRKRITPKQLSSRP